MATKIIGNNFQWGSTGRTKTDKAITVKVRQNKKTKSVNVRCSKNSERKACEVAESLAAKAIASIREAQKTDEVRKRERERKAAKKAARASLEKAPF